MKIRHRLLLVYGGFIALVCIGGGLSLHGVETIGRRLSLVEAADDLTNTILEMRRHEKNFLSSKAESDLWVLQAQIEALKKRMDGLSLEIVRRAGSGGYGGFQSAYAEYRRYAGGIAEQFRIVERLEQDVETSGRAIEGILGDEELKAFLALRNIEKSLRIDRSGEIFEEFLAELAAGGFDGNAVVGRYRDLVQRLAEAYHREVFVTDGLREKGRGLLEFAGEFSGKERREIDRILGRTRALLAGVMALIVVLGTVASSRLAASISTPIVNLERVTRKIAEGDYSESITVRGSDEIASLETTFNQMEERLKSTFSSLELAVKNLHEKQGQLIEAEKLASIGTLAAGVAHEINNPLAVINEKAGLIQDILASGEPFRGRERVDALLEGILKSVGRCSTITHRLLGFARRMDVVAESLDLDATLREVLDFLGSEILFKDIRVETSLDSPLPITSDREQLQQVFLNIIKNAVDALERGGTIRISTAPLEKRAVLVTIADNGPGIPRERLKRVFEPFFTTKGRAKGTGLGLSVSYGIMRKLGGTIRVESEVGLGTTFTVEVPVQATAHSLKEEPCNPPGC